ncbi:hypothetical protein FRB90_011381 [Tulasnella sp. 427]|nr:hypothetical protein FRB90_011381 [Tulasnella sp. 427]
MHETLVCEYRHQVVGHQLLLLLTWTDPGAITPELRNQRKEAIRHGRWNECCGPPEDAEPVAIWLKRVTEPGDFILIPPGTFVIEYSSGSAVVAEGQFLPWFCIPRLSLLATSPDIYILKALLLIAPTSEKSGRATPAQVRALIELVRGHEMEKKLMNIIKQYTRV